MSRALTGTELAEKVGRGFPGAVAEANEQWVTVDAEQLVAVATHLRDDPELDFRYLIGVCGVDRLDHFEVVYQLQSLSRNHTATLKTLARDHLDPQVPSLTPVWQGAQLQEREVFDLMGIRFEGHPDLRRIFLWDGFPGYPLRKDWLGMPGGRHAGLGKFPRED
jgi:NADH-quinone oxidoreductase subunit C